MTRYHSTVDEDCEGFHIVAEIGNTAVKLVLMISPHVEEELYASTDKDQLDKLASKLMQDGKPAFEAFKKELAKTLAKNIERG